jgi:hypothetical protein
LTQALNVFSDKIPSLEFFRKVAETGEAPAEGSRFIYPPTIAKTLGFRLIEVGPGTATMELMADTEIHANPMGTIHGGVFHKYWRAWRAEQEINAIGA